MKGILQFSPLWDRWYFMNESVEYDLHCGEVLEIRVGDRYYDARIEMSGEGWYVILHKGTRRRVSFVLMRSRTYAARWIFA